jgi:hypothetical protein
MKRTASMGSWVGPAEMRIRRPDRELPSRGFSRTFDRTNRRIRSVPAMRPRPFFPEARGPDSGVISMTPRSARFFRWLTEAGWRYIASSIAGAMNIGRLEERTRVERRSSARPSDIRAMKSAEAGAIRRASALFRSSR